MPKRQHWKPVEKARKEQDEGEEAARKEKEVEKKRIEQSLRRIPRKCSFSF